MVPEIVEYTLFRLQRHFRGNYRTVIVKREKTSPLLFPHYLKVCLLSRWHGCREASKASQAPSLQIEVGKPTMPKVWQAQ